MSPGTPREPRRIHVERSGSRPAAPTSVDERIEQVWTLTVECWPGTRRASVNRDFVELLQAFVDREVERLVVER